MKALTKNWLWFLVFIPLVLALLVLREYDEIPIRDISSYFPREKLKTKEDMIFLLLSEERNNSLSFREKKELAKTIARSSERLEIPDGIRIGKRIPKPELFLLSWVKARTDFMRKPGSGILNLDEKFVRLGEGKYNIEIDRDWDLFSFSIQFKLALLLFKEQLSAGKDLKQSYEAIFQLTDNSEEWQILNQYYEEKHKQAYSEKD